MARLAFAEKNLEPNKYKRRRAGWRTVSLLLEQQNKQWWEDPDVVVAFNLPRISARLERLMGTNVVRLTDRNYMRELCTRIEDDYRQQLQKRIIQRELKEIERERLLIIDGKTDIIPDELAEDPVFLVNKHAEKIIQKQRAKLKTNRQKNAERLKSQGVKWERERLQHEEEERKRMEELYERRQQQKLLEERYKTEDAERGMDLLRIENDDWRDCETKLREFLEEQRDKMMERSRRVPTPFSSDPLDIQNIVRARKKFRETEHRLRQQLESKSDKECIPAKQIAEQTDIELVRPGLLTSDHSKHDFDLEKRKSTKDSTENLLLATEQDRLQQKYIDDASDDIEESELIEQGSTLSESNRRHMAELAEDMESDIAKGLLISKEQYDHLRYEDEKIIALRNATSIRELYRLAEEIIIGERIEEEYEDEEEMEGEEEVNIYPESEGQDVEEA